MKKTVFRIKDTKGVRLVIDMTKVSMVYRKGDHDITIVTEGYRHDMTFSEKEERDRIFDQLFENMMNRYDDEKEKE